jgi:signal transduction histidine kinase
MTEPAAAVVVAPLHTHTEVDATAVADDPHAGIPPELRRIQGPPFGRDEHGRPIAHGSGRIVVGAIRYLESIVGATAEREAPVGIDPAARTELGNVARRAALDRLVEMLNAAVPDERYRVSLDYLLNESNNYSYEFRLFVAEYARHISGDPDFFLNLGRRSIPAAIVQLARPIGVRQTFALLSRFTARYVHTDLRVIGTTPTSAVVRWSAASQLELVPPSLHRHYVDYACQAYRGTFAAIPNAVRSLPPAHVRQISCQVDGDPTCEWEFTWQSEAPSGRRRDLAIGAGASAVLLTYVLVGLPAADVVAVMAATLMPAAVVVFGAEARRRTAELRQQQTLLLEQRELSEREYDRSEQANAELQQANLELRDRLSELMTVNEIGAMLSATLDLDELLARSLRSVVGHLRFDRALILLVDEARGVLTGARSVGATAEMERLLVDLEVPVGDPDSQLAALYRAPGPVLFRDVDQDPHEPNRQLAEALGVTSFLGTPLVTKGRTVGILAVDNRLSGREVESGTGPLLFTLGNLIAGAIENARLYGEVEAQNRELERRVAERTEALVRASEEAQEARAAAEAASEAKGQFLANVSHQLRTPLTSVVGFTKIIRKRLDEVVFPAVRGGGEATAGAAAAGDGAGGDARRTPVPDARVERAIGQIGENLAIMVAEGERLTSMINDVLDLAKIEAGRMEFRRDQLTVDELVARASAATTALVGGAGLSFVTEVQPDLPALVGDRDRLLQVLINLVSNAVKFTPSGSITCRAERRDGEVVVSVIDTGVGIDPAEHDKVFEQFRQVGDTLTDKPRGTGLGLPICRQIVEHHGGRLWLERSAPGEGSTFAFSLPIAERAASELAEAHPAMSAPAALPAADAAGIVKA